MTVIRAFLPSDDRSVLVNGVKLASVQSVRELETSSVHKIECFGDAMPAAVLTNGTEYLIELSIENALGDGIDFEGLTDFTVKIDGRLYGGCRCAKLERITKQPNGPEIEFVTIAAESRQEA